MSYTVVLVIHILQSLVLISLQNTHGTPWKPARRSDGRELEIITLESQIDLSRLNLVLCCLQISLACVFEDKNLSVFRSLRTLRALRPLRAISRMEGMKVTDAEFIY